MNFFQSMNGLFFGLTLAALLSGLAKIPTPITERPLTLWLFAAFLFLLRLKMFLDDHKYFGQTQTRNVHFKIGLIVGALSWILWGMSAWSVGALQDAYFLLGAAITISTLWIIVVAVRLGAYREQYIWIGTNASFVMLLWAASRRHMPRGDWPTWVLLGIALLLAFLDLFFSKSIPELDA